MRVGVQLPEVERVVRWPELAAIARAAEAGGLDSVWVGDHLVYREPERGPWEAWTTLAALAAVTERVELGPLVACLGFHPPAVLAKMAAAVQEISGGRFVLGLGAGWNRDEFAAFGLPFDKRVSRFEEGFDVLRRALAGERVSAAGTYVTVEDLVLLPPLERPPALMLGSNGPRMLSIGLPHVQRWNTWWDDYGNRPDGFADLNASITEACGRAGRDPAEVERSACVLVEVEPGAGERPRLPEAPPVPLAGLRAHLAALAQAGADEAILVLDPITEDAVRAVCAAL